MNRIEILNKKLLRLRAKADKLDKRASEATDAAEVEMLTEQRAELTEEIAETEAEIEALNEEDKRSAPPAAAEVKNAGIVASFSMAKPQQRADECVLESAEYRKAFMQYIQRGTPISAELTARVNEYRNSIPAEQRAAAIDTADTGAAIPLTIMREIINTVRVRYGNLYNRTNRMSVAGGVEIPIGELQANFSWINESTVSPDKELDKLGSISFRYNVAEIRIAQTFLSSILTMDVFEQKIVDVIVVAYLKAMDEGIVKGSGVGQMLGILNDPRVTAQEGHVITFTAAQLGDWTQWEKRFFSKLPLGYRSGEFIFPVSTVDAHLKTMADANNRPLFREATGLEVNDGDAVDPNGRFFGRRISLVEPDIIGDFDGASSNDVIGIYWQPEEYAINENFGFAMRRYYDEDRNKWITKALTVVDGKVLNPKGFYIFKKA